MHPPIHQKLVIARSIQSGERYIECILCFEEKSSRIGDAAMGGNWSLAKL
jgi:hypothetical protein